MVMIKDNHISIAGGVTDAIKSVDQFLEQSNLQMGVEVVCLTYGLEYLVFLHLLFLVKQ